MMNLMGRLHLERYMSSARVSEESDHAHYLFLQSQPAILAVNTKKDETVVKPGKVNNAVIKCFNSNQICCQLFVDQRNIVSSFIDQSLQPFLLSRTKLCFHWNNNNALQFSRIRTIQFRIPLTIYLFEKQST